MKLYDDLAAIPKHVEAALGLQLTDDDLADGQVFQMALDRLQPSQLYISAEKLRKVLETAEPPNPIPIKKIGAYLVMTDGHTRAFAAWSRGQTEVPVEWDEDDMDWEAYEICVQWCMEENIYTIADLADRVVDGETYQARWLDRCAAMHRELQASRGLGQQTL